MTRNTLLPTQRWTLRTRAGEEATRFVSYHQGVRRVLASNDGVDLLYASGLDPGNFLAEDGQVTAYPVLIQCQDGQWFALSPDSVNIGYPGQGPGNAATQLTHMGIDEHVARNIALSPYSDVHFGPAGDLDGTPVHLDTPPYRLGWPTVINGEWTVLLPPGHDPDGAAGGISDQTRRWASFLATPSHALPPWLGGERSAIVFLDPELAAQSGFLTPSQLGVVRHRVTAVIRRRHIALWILCPEPVDSTRFLHPVAYDTLELFSLAVPHLQALDDGARWRRRLYRLLGPRPGLLTATQTATACGHEDR